MSEGIDVTNNFTFRSSLNIHQKLIIKRGKNLYIKIAGSGVPDLTNVIIATSNLYHPLISGTYLNALGSSSTFVNGVVETSESNAMEIRIIGQYTNNWFCVTGVIPLA